METIYLFSGLGVDHRAFARLDLHAYHCVDVPWILPFKSEKIEDYAHRLVPYIKEPSPIFIGLSFGGMMAIEVAKHIAVSKVILISSVKNAQELPFYFRWAGKLQLYRFISAKWLACYHPWSAWLFGAHTDADKKLLAQIIRETNLTFLKWAVKVILLWKNDWVPDCIEHIHGSNDHILPIRFVHADKTMMQAGHLMVLNRASETSALLKQAINTH